MKKSVWFVWIMVSFIALNTACSSKVTGDFETKEKTQKHLDDVINVAFPIFDSVPKDMPEVEAALNQITERKIHAKVKLLPINFGIWIQKTNLMLTSDEDLDLLVVAGSSNYNDLVEKEQLLPIDGILQKYGRDILNSMDLAYLNACKIHGQIYGVPSIRDLAADYGITMRKDLLDKYHLNIRNIHTLDDVEFLLKTIHAKEPDIAPIMPAAISFVDTYFQSTFDPLGDSIGVLPNFDNQLIVVDLYETPEYAAFLNRIRKWYTSGFVLKDAATTKESRYNLVNGNRVFSYTAYMKPGYQEQETRSSGLPMIAVNLTKPVATTSNVTNFLWSIPRKSRSPKKTMEFLNLMYSDKNIVNLLDWGIEGKDFVKLSDHVIDYPPGVSPTNVGYNLDEAWLFGNEFLSYVFNGDNENIWNQLKDFNRTAYKSKALGFTFDPSSVKTEETAVANIISQYKPGLETGTLDPANKLPEFISKIKAAGIDKIIKEKQTQLDAWAAAKQAK
ncbi:ABC transporter substrate-binding protein [Bacillus sp. BRMEA1]|uniref:ABC transporter substrate-binding protein n=1 Tax=Neobacillus endophyticus TaxID=2738405 RepID=UPI00156338A8|nr:ABC transporter substrate-binding protein [Neobacillus endophyticus]NRD78298.1 ABC transporter substrate-binding protein [Neobacillus endophyticus]